LTVRGAENAGPENARHEMQARTLYVLLKKENLKLIEFLRVPWRNCARSSDETTVVCKQSPGHRRSKQLEQTLMYCNLQRTVLLGMTTL